MRNNLKIYQKQVTSFNKLNPKQKELMAEFMNEHQDLAKNLIPNCAQGKVTANRLWDELTERLNAVGPPVKDVKMWKKAYADQKYQVKKKLFFNKLSKKRAAAGGPYEEKLLTLDEEILIEAAGLKAAVEGSSNQSVPIFGKTEAVNTADSHHCSIDGNDDIDEPCSSTRGLENKTRRVKTESGVDQKLELLERNIKAAIDFQMGVEAKLDRLLEIQEQMLEIQKERHNVYMTIAQLDMKIKRKQIDASQKKMPTCT